MSLTAAQIDAIPSLTLSELEKNDQASVWVFNMSGIERTKMKRGIINLSVNDGIGNTMAVRVTITWICVDLTTQVTKSALVLNPEFRRLVSRGVLKIISEEEALKIVNTPEGIAETQKVHTSEQYTGSFEDQPVLNDVVDSSAVNAIAMSVVSRDDLDDEACISLLSGHEMVLKRGDFEYISKNSRFPRVTTWALERL